MIYLIFYKNKIKSIIEIALRECSEGDFCR